MTKLQEIEHSAWTVVCQLLEQAGVVTEHDLESPSGIRRTPGQKILGAIRDWGDAVVAVEKHK